MNSPGFWIYLCFWMCQSFGYTRVLNMSLVLNMPGFLIYQGSEGLEYKWIIPEYTWLCLTMSELFLFYISPFPHLLCNLFSIRTRRYLSERLQEGNRNTRLFYWRDKIWFFLYQLEIFHLFFCFRLNICCYFSGPRGMCVCWMGDGAHESSNTLLLFCFSLVKH